MSFLFILRVCVNNLFATENGSNVNRTACTLCSGCNVASTGSRNKNQYESFN